MKKVMVGILTLLLMLNINATVMNNYLDTIKSANDYIEKFKKYKSYIVVDESIKFKNTNGTLGIDSNFKKGGLINKIPEKHLCFAIEQELIEGQKSPKTLIIICNNNTETNLIWGSVEIIVDYIKRRCGKEYKLKIDDYKQFFDEIEFEQSNKNYDRKKSVFLINKIK